MAIHTPASKVEALSGQADGESNAFVYSSYLLCFFLEPLSVQRELRNHRALDSKKV